MYVARVPEEILSLAHLVGAIQFFDNYIKVSIKEVARLFRVSESSLHYWKSLLMKEGPKVFSSLKPGRRKETLSSHSEPVRVLVSESVNHLVVGEKRHEGKNRKFSPQDKLRILKERDKLKEDYSIPYEVFAELIGIDSGSTRLWARKLRQEGRNGLENHSRTPKHSPQKVPLEIIDKIVAYALRWKRGHRGRIKLVEFAACFRWKYHKLLARYGRSNLSHNTIAKYLKESGLYKEKEERPKGKRGAFRYYFPGAQLLIDSTVKKVRGITLRVIGVWMLSQEISSMRKLS